MLFVLLVGYIGAPASTLKVNADSGGQYVFGERGWGTRACEDIASSSWEHERAESDERWFVKAAGGEYGCGDCSVGCTGIDSIYQVSYNLSDVDKCPTRFLNEVGKSPFDCKAFPDLSATGEPYQKIVNIAVYGSSHSRVLFFHLWRLLAGKRWPEPLSEYMVSPEAGGGNGGIGRYGGHQHSTFDLCKGRLRLNVVFHFKRFFLSTGNENHFLQVLDDLNMTDLDLLVTEESVWSRFEAELRRGRSRRELQMGDPDMCQSLEECAEGWNVTMASEEQYYLDWLVQHFSAPKMDTLIAVGSGEHPSSRVDETADFITRIAAESAKHSNWKACVLDRRILGTPPAGMVCGHGCDGPAVSIQAQAILRSISGVLKDKHQSGEF